MRYRVKHYFSLVRVINQAIRESTQSATPNVFAQRMPAFGKPANPFNCRNNFQLKRVAEAGHLTVLARNCHVEFLLGDFE